MSEQGVQQITNHFSTIEDPRVAYLVRYPLIELITISICAVLCGANDWEGVAQWGKSKKDWLNKYLLLERGIPSSDTFRRVFESLDPDQFQESFLNWTLAVFQIQKGQIAIDGKIMRGSDTYDSSPLDMVSAWATEQQLVLGQQRVEGKSNEITAIPLLLKTLDLEGCIVTIDAMGCQTEIASQIVEQGGEYLLAVKKNQGKLFDDIEFTFKQAQKVGFIGIDSDFDVQKGYEHGREEKRECWILDDEKALSFLRTKDKWKDLQTIVLIRSHRVYKDKYEIKDRYYISNSIGTAATFLQTKRMHWGIENSLHWCLDIGFREDAHQLQKGNGPANFAILRHISMNLLKQEKTVKCGIANKRLRCGWDEKYFIKVLNNYL